LSSGRDGTEQCRDVGVCSVLSGKRLSGAPAASVVLPVAEAGQHAGEVAVPVHALGCGEVGDDSSPGGPVIRDAVGELVDGPQPGHTFGQLGRGGLRVPLGDPAAAARRTTQSRIVVPT
jgi:hypothetical protein